MSKKVVQTKPFYLQSGIDGTQTSVVVSSIFDIYGNEITSVPVDVGFYVATCEPRSPSNQESWNITAISPLGAGQSSLTVVRKVEAQPPYAPLAGTVPHGNGSEVIITNGGLIYDEFLELNEDNTVTGEVTFTNPNYPKMDTATPPPTLDEEFATKKYADDLAIAGAPDASTTVKGIVEEATQTETDNGTATGGTGARLFVNPVRQRSRKLSDYDADTGMVNAIAITPAPTITAYAVGQRFNTIVAVTNTGATTVSVNGLAATPLMKLNGVTPLVAGDLVAGQAIEFEYDGTNFQLITPVATPPATLSANTISGVAGENISGGTLPVPVYFNSGDGRWYMCDANDQTKLDFSAFATSTATTGNAITIQTGGIVSGFSALTVGKQYVQDTAGTIAPTMGTYEVLVGYAVTATQVLIQEGTFQYMGSATNTSTTITAPADARFALVGVYGTYSNAGISYSLRHSILTTKKGATAITWQDTDNTSAGSGDYTNTVSVSWSGTTITISLSGGQGSSGLALQNGATTYFFR